jgi:hypothetical protein
MKTADSHNPADTPRAAKERSGPSLLGAGTVGAILIVIVLVAVLTFVRQMTGRDAAADVDKVSTAPSVRLTFPDLGLETTCDYVMYSKGHQDFWFRNTHPNALDVGLLNKSCDACTGVSIAVLSPDTMSSPADWKQFQTWAVSTRAALIGLGTQGPLVELLPATRDIRDMHEQYLEKLHWHPLERADLRYGMPSVTVPAGALGVVRVAWEAKKEVYTDNYHLSIELWSQTAGSSEPRSNGPSLSIPLKFVRALRLEPEETNKYVGDVWNGRQATYPQDFKVWSSTINDFRLEAKSDSPCVVSTVRPLTREEILALERAKNAAVWCAYAVHVTVYDEREGHQLDLGPFAHHLHLIATTRGGEKLSGGNLPDIILKGAVRNDMLTVTSPAPTSGQEPINGRIDLGSYPAGRTKTVDVTIETKDPQMKVKLDKLDPPELTKYLQVKGPQKTTNGGPAPTWDLPVTVLADAPSGGLPEGSAILLILDAPGRSPRGIRVPIKGEGVTALLH